MPDILKEWVRSREFSIPYKFDVLTGPISQALVVVGKRTGEVYSLNVYFTENQLLPFTDDKETPLLLSGAMSDSYELDPFHFREVLDQLSVVFPSFIAWRDSKKVVLDRASVNKKVVALCSQVSGHLTGQKFGKYQIVAVKSLVENYLDFGIQIKYDGQYIVPIRLTFGQPLVVQKYSEGSRDYENLCESVAVFSSKIIWI